MSNLALPAPARLDERADATAAVRQHTKLNIVDALAFQFAEPAPSPVQWPGLSQGMSTETAMSSEIDLSFDSFVSSGFVSLAGSDEKNPVREILDL